MDMEWISVKTELPKYSSDCLVILKGESLPEWGCYDVDSWCRRERHEGEVTHWIYIEDIPLPKDK